ncbi:hypothetical protein ANTPLA_LOCUS10519 [Anthophora plagiata]
MFCRKRACNLENEATNCSTINRKLTLTTENKKLTVNKDSKTLRLLWSPNTDELRFTSTKTDVRRVTKRTILSDIAHIFDPLTKGRGLSFVLNKTEFVVLTKRRINTIHPMWVGDITIETKNSARYLGVPVDTKLNFGEHIRLTAEKAEKVVTVLSRLMANTTGPRASKRRLLLYGAEGWTHALTKRVRSGECRGATYQPARQAVYRRRGEDRDAVAKEERERTLRDWQLQWDQETRGRWSTRLIADLRT